MNAEMKSSTKPETFFLLWFTLTGAVVMTGALVFKYAFVEMEFPTMLSTGIFLGGIPLLASLVQWPLIITYRKCMHWWVPATLLGSLLNGLIGPIIMLPLVLMQMYGDSFSFGEIGMVVFIILCLSPSGLIIGLTQWLLVTALTMVLSAIILRWIQYHSGYPNDLPTSLGLSFGLPTFLTASAQWLVLRTQIREERAWIPVTLLGCLFVLLISPVLYKILISILENSASSNSITTSFFILVITSLPSFILALLQYLALETKVSRAALWIPTLIVVRLIGGSLNFNPVYFKQFFDWAIRGCLQGLITGAVMTFMIFQSLPYDAKQNDIQGKEEKN